MKNKTEVSQIYVRSYLIFAFDKDRLVKTPVAKVLMGRGGGGGGGG